MPFPNHPTSSRTAAITAGTVTVSHSLELKSSVTVPDSAPAHAARSDMDTDDPCPKNSTQNPLISETMNMAVLPSQDFVPSASFNVTLCFPYGMPTSAAAASHVPHIRIAAAA